MAEVMSFANKFLLAQIETTEGTNPGLDGADVIRTKNLQAVIYDGDTNSPEYDGDGGRYRPDIRTNYHNTLSCEVDAAGSGAAGTAPAFGSLLRACGMAETVAAGVSVSYQVEDTNQDSVSLMFVRGDSQEVETTGARGELGFRINNGIPEFVISNMKGTYHRPVDMAAAYTVAYANQEKAVPISADNTTTITLGGVALCIADLSIANFGQTVSRQDYVNCNSTRLVPGPVQGSMTILAPDIATKNWFTDAESHLTITEQVFSMVHGTTAGNIVSLDAQKVQVSNIQETDVNGQLGYSFDLRFLDNPVIKFT